MKSAYKNHFTWRQGLFLTVVVVALYVLLPQIGQFKLSFTAVKTADVELLALAFACILGAALTAALSYSQLSFRSIPFHRIALIQYAGMFTNRLLPAGIGGISLFIDFLYRQGHTLARASTIAAVNNGLGFAAHLTLLLIAAVTTGFTVLSGVTYGVFLWALVGVVVVFFAIKLLLHYVRQPNKIAKFIRSVTQTLKLFRRRKLALLVAYISCIGTTSLHVIALNFVIHAFGVELPLAASLVILTGGVAAATVTPTPGGLIGAEAALTAALITYNVDGSTALAIALSYRLVQYWLPILPGIAAFLFVQNRKYI